MTGADRRNAAAKPVKPQVVSRLLGKALAPHGIHRAEAETTSVRGWYRYSPGFEVIGARLAYEDGLVDDPASTDVFVLAQTIDDQSRHARPGEPGYVSAADRTQRILDAAQTALDAAGFVWAREGSTGREHIRVTGRIAHPAGAGRD